MPNIVINVAGEPAGSPGVAREFTYDKINPTPPLVTLTIDDNTGITQWAWEILAQPADASSVIGTPTASSATFTPTAYAAGTYLIRCTLNGSVELTNAVAWKTLHGNYRIPAPGETTEFGVLRGWDPALKAIFDSVEDGTAGGRQRKVIDYVTSTSAPPTEVRGDRYILDDSGTPHASWDGAAQLDIVEFNGTTWDAITPEEGWTAYVDLQNKDGLYTDDGTPAWTLKPVDHAQVHDLGGADHNAATLAELSAKVSDATSLVGTTNTQTLTNKTLTTPTIGDFTNATHNHTDAASGGLLSGVNLDTGYDNFGASAAIVTINNAEGQGSLIFKPTAANSFQVDLTGNTGTVNGFLVTNGADQFDLIYKGAGAIDLDADLRAVDINASILMQITSASLTLQSSGSLTFTDQYLSGNVTLSESGETALDTTSQSIVGAINEVHAGLGAAPTFDDIYDNESGAHVIYVNDGPMLWDLYTDNNFNIYVENSAVGYGFQVYDDTDYFRLYRAGDSSIALGAELQSITTNTSSRTSINSTTDMYLNPDGDSDIYLFNSSPDSVTPSLRIYGYYVSASLRYLDISCGSDADDTASFSGLSNYYFGGNLGIGVSSPSYKLSVGSVDNSQQTGLYHSNSHAFWTTTSGQFFVQTDQGTNTNTYMTVQGKGTGTGYFRISDDGKVDYLESYCTNGVGYMRTSGVTPSRLVLQGDAHAGVNLFESAASGETQELRIYGYRAADSSRYLSLACGTDAADTASFSGLSNYYFDGKLDSNNDVFRLRTSKTPSSASDTGNAGDICWDSSYIYVCVATDTWERAAIATW